jgi:hypothetical protein
LKATEALKARRRHRQPFGDEFNKADAPQRSGKAHARGHANLLAPAAAALNPTSPSPQRPQTAPYHRKPPPFGVSYPGQWLPCRVCFRFPLYVHHYRFAFTKLSHVNHLIT